MKTDGPELTSVLGTQNYSHTHVHGSVFVFQNAQKICKHIKWLLFPVLLFSQRICHLFHMKEKRLGNTYIIVMEQRVSAKNDRQLSTKVVFSKKI